MHLNSATIPTKFTQVLVMIITNKTMLLSQLRMQANKFCMLATACIMGLWGRKLQTSKLKDSLSVWFVENKLAALAGMQIGASLFVCLGLGAGRLWGSLLIGQGNNISW